jgi:murein DD-endopeptidase MepM/ murein hydrolase activator NlpD
MRRALRTAWGRFVAVLRRLFRRREFVVRSDGQLRYVVLSTTHQAAMASIGVALTGWLVYSSGSLLLREIRLSEIRQAKASYLNLLADVGASDEAFAVLSGESTPGELVLPELSPREDGATVDIASAEEALQRSEAERTRIATGREALQADLRRFGTDLQTITDRNRELKDNIAALKQELQTVVGEKAQVVATRERLSAELKGAEAELAQATERYGLLASNLQTLEERLAALDSGSANGKAVLNWQIASLKQQLSDARNDEATLENRVRSIVGSLSGVIGERDTLQTARAELREQVEDVEERLETLQESQDAIVQSLVDRARGGVDEVEKTVAMTGLDVEMLLSRTENEQQGTGGPFIPLDQQVGNEILLASVADLDDTVQRWERLQAILRTLPLTSPVDSYWVASLFGPRKDPVTGRRAMHEGVDLSGPMKAPVLSPGPGRVTFAGRNGGYGRMVEIDHGLGITTRYGHLHSISVSVGDMVDYRDRIGLLGSSGRSTGPHVHYEIRVDDKPTDPMNFLKAGRYVFKG